MLTFINKETADIILEAFYWDYKLVDNVATKDKKVVLACITLFTDYSYQDEQIADVLTLRANLIEAYANHPDGEVMVQLTINQENVNI